MTIGANFEIDRGLPPPTYVNELFNAYLSAHLDEMRTTGELSLTEAVPAVFMALASRGKLDRRVHTNTAAVLALAQTGRLSIYRNPSRFDQRVGQLRNAMDSIWHAPGGGRLVIAPSATISPPRHGRALFHWTWQAFTRLGNLTDATAVAIPFGKFDDGLPRSIQIMGPAGSEEAVLDLAQKLEDVAP
jgi:Asp-tRNA(Asn)/Glu-tRNA(Gln) amidotransferase A subunit family amidase